MKNLKNLNFYGINMENECPLCDKKLKDLLKRLRYNDFKISTHELPDKHKNMLKNGEVYGYFRCEGCRLHFIVFSDNQAFVWYLKQKCAWTPIKIKTPLWRIA